MKKNKHGFSTLIAIIIVVIVFVISGIVQLILSSTASGQKVAQRRFEMSILENTVRLELNKPDSFNSCAFDNVNNKWSCALNSAIIPRLQMPISGIQCNTPPCGLMSSVAIIPAAAQPEAKVTISYNGKDVRLKDLEFIILIPKEALHSKSGICSGSVNSAGVNGYLYKGILADGTDDCRGLPSCADGSYFSGMNRDGTAKCSPLKSVEMVEEGLGSGIYSLSCQSNKYLNTTAFNPNSNHPVSISCKDRIDPCEVASGQCPGI